MIYMGDFLASFGFRLTEGPLQQLLAMGGPVMLVLVALAVLGLVTFIYLILVGAVFAPRLSGKVKSIITLWQRAPASVSPRAIRQQASHWQKRNPLQNVVINTIEALQSKQDNQKVRETAARDAQQALEPFEAPLKIIEVIAALAPLLGLLGTVFGMMEAFSAMAATEGRANASQLSGGIYEALTTTAAGLVVAIPFAALAAWIEFRLRRIHKVVNSSLVSVLTVTPEAFAGQPEPADDPASEAPAQSTASQAHQRTEGDEGFSAHGSQSFAHATG